jgi:anti-sigma B factor antagonist
VARSPVDPTVATGEGMTLRLEPAVRKSGSAGVPVLSLAGEFDIDTVPEIDRFLRRRLGPLYQRRTLVIDLHEVTLVDSSFVGFVVRLVGEQRRGSGELVLVRPVGRVRALLRMVGLPNLVPVYDSLDEGLRALREARMPLIPPAYGAAG